MESPPEILRIIQQRLVDVMPGLRRRGPNVRGWAVLRRLIERADLDHDRFRMKLVAGEQRSSAVPQFAQNDLNTRVPLSALFQKTRGSPLRHFTLSRINATTAALSPPETYWQSRQ